jgi:Fe-S oxidoreductase
MDRGEPEEERARELAAVTLDVTALLAALGLVGPAPELAAPTRVAYHDACHLLRAIGGVELVEPPACSSRTGGEPSR